MKGNITKDFNILAKTILVALVRLFKYMIDNNYCGYDQYDVLSSPLFKYPPFNNRLFRFGSQQIYRRIPFNTRKILGIKKEFNPVTAGLSIQAYSYLIQIFPEKQRFFEDEIVKLKKLLLKYQSKGYTGLSWGYNFDWEARYAKIDAFVPTSVATGIIANGLFEHYKLTGEADSLEMCKNSAKFILNDLNRSFEGDYFCFSYSPIDKQFVFNASMKAARLLAQVYSVTKDKHLLSNVYKAIKYVVINQREDGSWGYANHDARSWVDNYHTGYILDCLDESIKLTGLREFNNSLKKGIHYYVDTFFHNKTLPKFRSNKIYPIDSTGIGQSLLTLSRFGIMDVAENVANWSINNMQDKSGYFYFRKYKYFTNKISYMRWSNAWMLVGLSYFLFTKSFNNNNNNL